MMEHILILTGTADTSRQFDLPGDDPEVYTNDPDAVKPVPPLITPEETPKAAPETTAEAPADTQEAEAAEEAITMTTEEEPDPAPEPDLLPLWIGLGVLGGILIGALAAILCRRLLTRKKNKKAAAYPSTPELTDCAAELPSTVQISKLHELGARSGQQDSFAVSPAGLLPAKGLLAVVCDGMGGLQDGDKVSQAAVSAMLNGFLELQGDPQRLLLGLLARANRAVNFLLGPSGQRRSGTTMVAGILKDDQFAYLSVGDSRICLYRAGRLIQLNREHVYVNDLSIDAINELTSFREVWTNPQQGALTSFLGMGELKYIDIPAQPLQVLAGDKLILMSDGVYNALTLEEMTAALALPSGEDTEALRAAIDAKHYEHQDNYTAVVLTVPAA